MECLLIRPITAPQPFTVSRANSKLFTSRQKQTSEANQDIDKYLGEQQPGTDFVNAINASFKDLYKILTPDQVLIHFHDLGLHIDPASGAYEVVCKVEIPDDLGQNAAHLMVINQKLDALAEMLVAQGQVPSEERNGVKIPIFPRQYTQARVQVIHWRHRLQDKHRALLTALGVLPSST